MERSDPLAAGAGDSWHTNNGLFVRGLDASGNPVIGTPRDVNSRPIVERAGATKLPWLAETTVGEETPDS